jgi:hypothetical protein
MNLLCAAIIIACQLALLGCANAPLTVVLMSQGIAWLAWLLLARHIALATAWPRAAWLLPFGLALIFVTAPPVLDDDVWRFLWDGWITSEGGNPYRSQPADFLRHNDLPPAMMSVLDRTAYPESPTVYGPVLQALFALSAWIAPGAIWPWKFMLMLALGAMIAGLRAWDPRMSAARLWLVAMSPPIFFECALNAHPDLIGIALLTAAFASATKHPCVSGVLMALSCGCRVQAFVMLPFLLWAWPWRGRISWLFSIAANYAPFVVNGSPTEWQGIAAFGSVWEFNSSLVALLGSDARARSLALVVAILLCGVAFIIWVRRGATLSHVPGVFCYAVLLSCSAVFNPWYTLWMLPFLAQPGSLWRWAWMALPSLSYITQGDLGIDLMNPFAHPGWLRPLEFSLLAIASCIAMKSWASSQSSTVSTSRSGRSSTQQI